MSVTIYLEGGGDSKDLNIRCREGFRKLLKNCGFAGRLPRLVACGSRAAAYDDFKVGHKTRKRGGYVGMLIDSEEPIADIEATWAHVKKCDGWKKPVKATDEQVLLMVTCMETWIVADRETLAKHYGSALQQSALPPLVDLESRRREAIQQSLAHATRKCPSAYAKGKQSFEVLAKLTPATLQKYLPSFSRVRRILEEMLT